MGSTRREFVRTSSVLAAAIVGLAAVPTAARVANSRGLFAYTRGAAAALTTTPRTPDGTGSGWAGASHQNLGMKIVDERVTLPSDPFDPDVARSPLTGEGLSTRRTVWILNDVVKDLNFDRYWAQKTGVSPTASGGSLEIESGEITRAVKNLRFNDSPVFMLNNLEALGTPVRVSASEDGGPVQAVKVPPLKGRDFNFTSVSDAV